MELEGSSADVVGLIVELTATALQSGVVGWCLCALGVKLTGLQTTQRKLQRAYLSG